MPLNYAPKLCPNNHRVVKEWERIALEVGCVVTLLSNNTYWDFSERP